MSSQLSLAPTELLTGLAHHASECPTPFQPSPMSHSVSHTQTHRLISIRDLLAEKLLPRGDSRGQRCSRHRRPGLLLFRENDPHLRASAVSYDEKTQPWLLQSPVGFPSAPRQAAALSGVRAPHFRPGMKARGVTGITALTSRTKGTMGNFSRIQSYHSLAFRP